MALSTIKSDPATGEPLNPNSLADIGTVLKVDSRGLLLTVNDLTTIAALQAIAESLDSIEIDADEINLDVTVLGNILLATSAKIADPDASTADIIGLVRGLFEAQGVLTDSKETDPDSASASLNSLLRGVLEAANKSSGEDAPNLISIIDSTTTTDVTYIGEAVPASPEGNAVWRIQAIDDTTAVTKVKWAEGAVPGTGDQLFDKIWTNRAALTYS